MFRVKRALPPFTERRTYGRYIYSLSEPHTSESNGGFLIYYYIYYYISGNTSWALLTRNIAHADSCGRKIENIAVLYRALSLQLHQLTEWSSQISAGARRPTMAQKETAGETADQRSERLRNWGWGTMPDALVQLLVKDKPLYSGKVCERETKPPRREERC